MWFQGGVGQAVAEATGRDAVFVVYAIDDGENSGTMTRTIEGDGPKGLLSTESFVCIKITRDTTEYTQFSQLFPVLKIPCIYLIGRNGIPLDIIAGVVEEATLVERINAVLAKHQKPVAPPSGGSSASSASVVRESSGAETVEGAEAAAPAPITSASATSVSENRPEEAGFMTREQKLARAQQLLEKRKAEKEQEEMEKEKEAERERRRVGKELLKHKQWQTDEERKKMADERKKDREEEKRARDRVLAQIEQDRQERAAKFALHKREEDDKEQERKQKESEEERRRMEAQAAEQSTTSRIQFRLPDGSSSINSFSADVTFGEVRSYVTSELIPKHPALQGQFKLSTLYPRQTFGPESDNQSLRSLQLAPTAVLLVLPARSGPSIIPSTATPGAVVATASTGVSWLFNSVWSFFYAIFEYVRFFVFGTPRTAADWRSPLSSSASGSRTGAGTRPQPEGAGDPSAGDAAGASSESGVRRRIPRETGRVLRGEGNIRKFANPEDISADDDDEDGTWNGNSTQQL